MKKFTILAIISAFTLSFAAYLKDIPMQVTQPDGTQIQCFATGDEFFNRLHDENDFTIIQGDDGWYYYGERAGEEVIASPFIAGKTDPVSAGLQKGVKISSKLYRERAESFNNFDIHKGKDAPTTGKINNLCIFIRFSDEAESIFNRQRSYYDAYFNKPEGPSLGHYFNEVSYQKLEVESFYYPHVDDFTTNLSYQDINPRSYFKPYNATTNPDGYSTDSERTQREHDLLERAVLAIADEVPTDLVIDSDGDGYVDNIVFLISGAPGAWASLLWPHRWSLYSKNVVINRKRVYDYNFDLTGTTTYFTVGVIAHEFFHTLGAPDLYHYYDDTAPDAVGAWDVMNDTSNPPQYMGAWMKYRYGDWITEVPVISTPGTYTLNPLTEPEGNIYRINSPNSSNEFFILEYRTQTGLYEAGLPGSDNGILIYRINSLYEGNADGPPDEVYIYRPNGTLTVNGNLSSALFSQQLGRTEFNISSNPFPFLSSGNEGGINITNIGPAGETISFDLALNVKPPQNVLAAAGYGSIEINWTAPEIQEGLTLSHYKIYRNSTLIADNITETAYTDGTVTENETYTYSVTAYYTGTNSGESSFAHSETFTYTAPLTHPYSTAYDTYDDWSQIFLNCSPRWRTSNSSNAGGTPPEMMADLEDSDNATSRFVSPSVSTTGIDTLLISFRHFYDAFEPGVTYKVQISRNKYDWTETDWSFSATGTDSGPSFETIELTEFPDPVYVAFTLEGYLWNYDGWYIDDLTIAEKSSSSINDNNIPSASKLRGNYPNPFNPETTINFELAANTEIELRIFDSRGSMVRNLASGNYPAGNYNVVWNGRNDMGTSLSSGIYYIQLKAGNEKFIHRSLMIK